MADRGIGLLSTQHNLPFNPNSNQKLAASTSKVQEIEYRAGQGKHQT
jgi:hypothetical protein